MASNVFTLKSSRHLAFLLTGACVTGENREIKQSCNSEFVSMSETGPTPIYLPPAADGRQSVTAAGVQRGVCRLLKAHGFAVLTEFTLATGRRADVAALKADGTVWIIEIKSSPEDFYVDNKWPEYRDYCDALYFAVPTTLDASILPDDAGLVVADSYGAEILRQAPPHPLVAARRKAITVSFARVAAQRLHGLWDP
jgi:hypothetical protein